MRFPNTLETVAGVELAHLKGQWKIGEAIQDDLKTVEAPAVRIAFAAWRKWWKERQGRLK